MMEMMMAAVHCDYIQLPAHYKRLVRQNIDKGRYYLTHAAFSLERLKENGCQVYTTAEERALRQEVAKGMVVLISAKDTIADLRYEAIAFLQDMGRRDLVRPEWIEQIYREQRADGSWAQQIGDAEGNDHATVLALWAILGYANPDAVDEPMIRH